MEPERSAAARALAEQALIWLLDELRGVDLPIIVLGGLVPEVLARDSGIEAPAHLGTTDVDILVSFHAGLEVDLAPLEEALTKAGFELDDKIREGWRWRARVGRTWVKVEFLCDHPDLPANRSVRLPGCEILTAANLRGTGFVARDFVTEELTGALPDGEVATVRANFAGLEGYVMAKAFAVRERGKDKDYYDFVYVLLNNREGGPQEIGARLASGQFAEDVKWSKYTFLELAARFAGPGDIGPRSYAHQTMQVNPEGDAAVLAQDAVAAVAQLIEALGFSG